MDNSVATTNFPLISLVTINLNNSVELNLTLESITKQNLFDCVEHIIIDGGSKDGSLKMIKEHANKYHNVKWISESDAGIYHAMNKGLKLATGNYVCFLNSGDRLYSNNTFKLFFGVIKKNKQAELLYGNLVMDNEEGALVRYWKSSQAKKWKVYLGWMPPHPMTCVSKHLIERVGVFDTQFKIAADYDFLLRCLFEAKFAPIFLNKNLVKMRAGGVSNSSIRQILYANFEVLMAWKKVHPLFVPIWILITKPFSKIFQQFFNGEIEN